MDEFKRLSNIGKSDIIRHGRLRIARRHLELSLIESPSDQARDTREA